MKLVLYFGNSLEIHSNKPMVSKESSPSASVPRRFVKAPNQGEINYALNNLRPEDIMGVAKKSIDGFLAILKWA